MKRFLFCVLLLALMVAWVGATPAFNFNDTFENEIVKGVISAESPFSTMLDNEDFGSVYFDGTIYHIFFSYSDGHIYVRNSTDGVTWGNKTLILEDGVGTWDDTKVYVPMVWKEGSTYYMIYGGFAADAVVAVGLATSSSIETGWAKSGSNPIYTNLHTDPGNWSYAGAEPWGIQKVGSTYYLWVNNYGGASNPPNGVGERQLGLITSTDLTDWTSDPNNPLFTGNRFCPFSFKSGSYYYLLVTQSHIGGYSKFELYRSSNPTFYNNSREFMGVILITPRSTTTWNGRDLDTPTTIFTDVGFDITDDPINFYYSAKNNTVWKMGNFTLAQSALVDRTLLAEKYTSANPGEQTDDFSLSTDTKHSGSKSLKIADSATHDYYQIPANAISGNVSFWVNETFDNGNLFIDGIGDKDQQIFEFQLSKWGNNQYYDGSTLKASSAGPSINNWYNVVINYNLTSGFWSYVMYNTVGGTVDQQPSINLTTLGMSEVNTFKFYRIMGDGTTFYLDDLQIFGDAVEFTGSSDTTPPASITNLANSTPDCQSIIWTWTNPVDADYDGLMYWFNNTLQSPNLTAAHTFVTFSGLLENIDYTLSTKTFDTTGNLDDTFVNSTVRIICDLPPTASFISNTTCGNVPFAVQFNDTSYSNITSWNWTFSEGNYSDLQDPVYQYNETGMFGINLSATNIYGNNWSNVTDYIRAVPAWYTCPPTPTPTPTWQPIINPSTDVKTNWLGLLREWWWLPALIFVMIILFRRK